MNAAEFSVADVEAFASSRGCHATRDAEFGSRTTYRVGGRARVLIETANPERLGGIGEVIGDDVPLLVIGNGSNVLVSDTGFGGVVIVAIPPNGEGSDGISFSDVAPPTTSATCEVTASAFVRLPVLARKTVAAGWCGLEWAVGVPGSVGGAVRMNAGGHGSDIESSLVSADVINLRTGTRRTVESSDLGLRFRGSALSDDHFVSKAVLRVHSAGSHDCAAELSSIVAWRREHQPGGQNAGSVFVNPNSGDGSAGALIDAAGLRGHRIRSAEVSPKHANFIQADATGNADDVVALMTEVQARVFANTGISMRSEIRLVGFSDEVERRFQDPHRHDPNVRDAEARLRSLV